MTLSQDTVAGHYLLLQLGSSFASTSKRTTIQFSDLKGKRYWFPLTMLQIGIGLLVLQQLNGINGVFFYSSKIFESADGNFAAKSGYQFLFAEIHKQQPGVTYVSHKRKMFIMLYTSVRSLQNYGRKLGPYSLLNGYLGNMESKKQSLPRSTSCHAETASPTSKRVGSGVLGIARNPSTSADPYSSCLASSRCIMV
nr:sugar transporter erd6-like 6 [Quercus suber]